MLPGEPGPFGPSSGGNGMFPGGPGGLGGPGGPPPADAMFESFLNEDEDLMEPTPPATRENVILDTGLSFFKKMKNMIK